MFVHYDLEPEPTEDTDTPIPDSEENPFYFDDLFVTPPPRKATANEARRDEGRRRCPICLIPIQSSS